MQQEHTVGPLEKEHGTKVTKTGEKLKSVAPSKVTVKGEIQTATFTHITTSSTVSANVDKSEQACM